MTNLKALAEERLDIVEELEARGDKLSLRAAKYIRLKPWMLAGREAEIRYMAANNIQEHRPPSIEGKA